MLFKTFDQVDDYNLSYLENDESFKRKLVDFVSTLNKEDFFFIIDFFCNSKVNISYYNNLAINYMFEYIFKTKNYYLDALKTYFLDKHQQYPLYPDTQITLMFEMHSDNEIWSIISKAPDNLRNIWQYYYFVVLPDRYIDFGHLQKWYKYLKDDSDKYIISSSYRDLLFLKKYLHIDQNVIIKSCKYILSKQNYSHFIVNNYFKLLLISLPERVNETIELFKNNYDSLSEIYLFNLSTQRHEDYHEILLKSIYEKYPYILDLLFEKWKKEDQYLTQDDTMKLSKLFELDDYINIFDNIMEKVINHDNGCFIFQEDEFIGILASGNLDKKYIERPNKWIKHFIIKYSNDEKRMRYISIAILNFSEEKRIEYIKLFLLKNKDLDMFKKLQFLPLSMSWSGSEIPLIQKRIDYLFKLLSLLNGLEFLKHKKHIEDIIGDLKKYMAEVEINEIIREF